MLAALAQVDNTTRTTALCKESWFGVGQRMRKSAFSETRVDFIASCMEPHIGGAILAGYYTEDEKPAYQGISLTSVNGKILE